MKAQACFLIRQFSRYDDVSWELSFFLLGQFIADLLLFYSRLKWLMRHTGVGREENERKV